MKERNREGSIEIATTVGALTDDIETCLSSPVTCNIVVCRVSIETTARTLLLDVGPKGMLSLSCALGTQPQQEASPAFDGEHGF